MDRAYLSAMIRKYTRLWEMAPEQINAGSCGAFVEMVIEALGGETDKLFASFTAECYSGHEWITYKGRHYDAEVPDGVDDANQLPWFLRQVPGIQ